MKAILVSLFLGFIVVAGANAEVSSTLASKSYVDIKADSVPIGRPAASAPADRVLLWVEE